MEKREEVFSKAVRAGKRTYFFDVKTTRGNDYYLTITESKKRFDENGDFHFDKHKIFLYKEDFEKFADGFEESISYIKEALKDAVVEKVSPTDNSEKNEQKTTVNVEFDDL